MEDKNKRETVGLEDIYLQKYRKLSAIALELREYDEYLYSVVWEAAQEVYDEACRIESRP